MKEYLDVLDEDGNPTGKREEKQVVHQKGIWHQVAHIWIYNSKGEMMIQLRSTKKKSFPGLWDIAAAGHIDAGEPVMEGAARELEEELGISGAELELVGVRKFSYSIPEKKWYNNEFTHVILLRFDGDIKSLKLREIEVDDVKFVPLDELESDLRGHPEKYVPHSGSYFFDMIRMVRDRI